MTHYVLLAGLSVRFHDELRKRLGSLERQYRDIVFVSTPLQWPTYNEGYARSLEARLAKASEKGTQEQGLLVLYLDHGPSSKTILEAFSRMGILARLTWPDRDAQSYHEVATTLNRLANEIGQRYARYRANLGIIREEVVNRRNRTPLLLPPQNFGSDHLRKLLDRMSMDLIDADTPEAAAAEVEGHLAQFNLHHPVVLIEKEAAGRRKGRKSYRNYDGTVFAAPGSDLHGQLSVVDGSHRSSCLIAARFRVGHGYHPAFHYDCEFKREAKRQIPSCHGLFDRPGRTTHVNISPNDFARKAK